MGAFLYIFYGRSYNLPVNVMLTQQMICLKIIIYTFLFIFFVMFESVRQ